MANEILIFDATASNIDGTDPGSPLTVGPGTSYRLREGTEFPGAPLDVLYASSVDTEGELPSSRRFGNRTLTIKLGMIDPTGTLLAALRAKFAKFQREGGTLKRTLKNGDVRIYDIVAGDGWNPNYDWAYWRSDFTEVEMKLPARPLSRGVAVTLSDHVETTLPYMEWTETGIAGDVPGLLTVVADNDSANYVAAFFWGLESRYYAGDQLFFQAESGSILAGGATAAGPAGASGTTVHSSSTLPTAFTAPMFALKSTPLAHVGLYQVLSRCRAPSANTGTVGIQFTALVDGQTIENDIIDLSDGAFPVEDAWHVMDLGQVRLNKPIKGAREWQGTIEAKSTAAGDDVFIDWVLLVPVLECSGFASLSVSGTTNAGALAPTKSVEIRSDSVLVQAGSVYQPARRYEGDLATIPPAGSEARTTRIVLKTCNISDIWPSTLPVVGDVSIDDISARVTYTPRYLT